MEIPLPKLVGKRKLYKDKCPICNKLRVMAVGHIDMGGIIVEANIVENEKCDCVKRSD